MIVKTVKYSSFSKCLAYVLGKANTEILDSNLIGTEAKELAYKFRLCSHKNSRVKQVLFHAILAISPDWSLKKDVWTEIAKKYLEEMGFVDCPYTIVQHNDRPHQHLHLLAGRVRADGSCVSVAFDYSRSERILRSLEKKYQLPSPATKFEKLAKYRPFSEESSSYQEIKSTIDSLCQKTVSVMQLLEQLQEHDISVRFHRTKRNNRIRGIIYEKKGCSFTGTQLGELYTWRGLVKKRGLKLEIEATQKDLGLSKFVEEINLSQCCSASESIEVKKVKSRMR
jgi:Relaxase/Mobilisation nuclease domain